MATPAERARTIEVVERERIPLDGLLLGWGAMLPFPALAAAVWLGGEAPAALALDGLRLWGGAILIFLSGVRRGLSFRTESGPRPAQLASFAWLFLAGLAVALVPPLPGLMLILAGFASLLVLDPIAARRGEAPLYFTRLRPLQMAVPVVSVGVSLALVLAAQA